MLDQVNARVFLLLMASRLVGDYVYACGGEEATKAATAVRRTAQGPFEHFDGQGLPEPPCGRRPEFG